MTTDSDSDAARDLIQRYLDRTKGDGWAVDPLMEWEQLFGWEIRFGAGLRVEPNGAIEVSVFDGDTGLALCDASGEHCRLWSESAGVVPDEPEGMKRPRQWQMRHVAYLDHVRAVDVDTWMERGDLVKAVHAWLLRQPDFRGDIGHFTEKFGASLDGYADLPEPLETRTYNHPYGALAASHVEGGVVRWGCSAESWKALENIAAHDAASDSPEHFIRPPMEASMLAALDLAERWPIIRG